MLPRVFQSHRPFAKNIPFIQSLLFLSFFLSMSFFSVKTKRNKITYVSDVPVESVALGIDVGVSEDEPLVQHDANRHLHPNERVNI